MPLEITKVPRKDAIPDIPINFPPLLNLHLEMMEIKKKLKRNLPPLPKNVPKPEPIAPGSVKSPAPNSVKSPHSAKISSEKNRGSEKERTEDDEAILNALGEETETELESLDVASGTAALAVMSPSSSSREEHEESREEKEETPPEEEDEYAGLSPEEREMKEKEEYLWRFKILKKQYRSATIPEWTEHSDLNMMKNSYRQTLKEVSLDGNIERYKMFLGWGWMGVEFVATQFLQIDFTGFAKSQFDQMSQYDSLLVELGERSYSTWTSNLPVEVRLFGFLLIQAGMFYLGKIMYDKFGTSAQDMFKAMSGQAPRSEHDSQDDEDIKPKKKKMRGPTMKANDIKNMSSEDE